MYTSPLQEAGALALSGLPAAAALRLPALTDLCSRYCGKDTDEAAAVFLTLALRLTEKQRITVPASLAGLGRATTNAAVSNSGNGSGGADDAANFNLVQQQPSIAFTLDPACGEAVGMGLLRLGNILGSANGSAAAAGGAQVYGDGGGSDDGSSGGGVGDVAASLSMLSGVPMTFFIGARSSAAPRNAASSALSGNNINNGSGGTGNQISVNLCYSICSSSSWKRNPSSPPLPQPNLISVPHKHTHYSI